MLKYLDKLPTLVRLLEEAESREGPLTEYDEDQLVELIRHHISRNEPNEQKTR